MNVPTLCQLSKGAKDKELSRAGLERPLRVEARAYAATGMTGAAKQTQVPNTFGPRKTTLAPTPRQLGAES